MNPFSPAQKWDVNSCDFELFGLSTMFSAILWFKRLCIVVQTIMEAKKSHFLAWNPTPELQNLRKRQKIMKIQQKMTETTRGRCGGKVGTKSVFTKKKFWKNHPRGKNWKNIFSFFGVFCSISQNFQKISKFIFFREEFFDFFPRGWFFQNFFLV